jgi:DsbC/DsbD-like thiol-disulfide interchange protein
MTFIAFINPALRVLLIAAFLVLPASSYSTSVPQSAPDIKITQSLASHQLKKGQSVQATIVMDIPAGYHVNSNRPLEKFLIPTQLTVEAPSGIRAGSVVYPRAVLRKFNFSKNRVSVYEGKARLRVNLTVPGGAPSGSSEIKLKLRYQSCSDEVCFPPQTKEMSLWLNVE